MFFLFNNKRGSLNPINLFYMGDTFPEERYDSIKEEAKESQKLKYVEGKEYYSLLIKGELVKIDFDDLDQIERYLKSFGLSKCSSQVRISRCIEIL